MAASWTVRSATTHDHLAVMRVLDGANLESDAGAVMRRIEEETVLVAAVDGRVVGALVAAPRNGGSSARIDAVAVRLRRRGQGVGTSLVEAAADRWRPLTADFYPGLSGFYRGLGFEVEKRDGQWRGVLE